MFPLLDEETAGFRVDPLRSSLRGYVYVDDPDLLLWCIHVRWHDPEADSGLQDAWIEIENLVLPVRGWRDLAGVEVRVGYAQGDVHPIMPGDSACFFFLDHAVANDNHIRLTDRQGQTFRVEWDCTLEWGGPPGEPISFWEFVTFTGISVGFPIHVGVDVDAAREIVAKHLPVAEVGDARVNGNFVEFSVRPVGG